MHSHTPFPFHLTACHILYVSRVEKSSPFCPVTALSARRRPPPPHPDVKITGSVTPSLLRQQVLLKCWHSDARLPPSMSVKQAPPPFSPPLSFWVFFPLYSFFYLLKLEKVYWESPGRKWQSAQLLQPSISGSRSPQSRCLPTVGKQP